MLWLLVGCIPSVKALEARCLEEDGRLVNNRCSLDTGVDDSAPLTPPEADPSQYVFVTSIGFDGALGGLAGGDAKCQLTADRANMPGTYVAWLSTDQTDARVRIVGDGPWRNRLGWQDAIVFGTPEEIVQFPANGILGDEAGRNGEIEPDAKAWTGTLQNGRSSGANCVDWSNNQTGYATVGSIGQTTADWTEATGEACTSLRQLYCFSTDVVTWPFADSPKTDPD